MTSRDKTWARIAAKKHKLLRRGAWYPVAERDDDEAVAVELRDRTVAVERKSVTIRTDRPSYWSVVDRTREDLAASHAGGSEFPKVYAVCPTCQARQAFTGSPTERANAMLCEACGKRSEVDWSETC